MGHGDETLGKSSFCDGDKYRLVFQLVEKLVFSRGGRGGGGRVGAKPSSLNICYRRIKLAFLIFQIQFVSWS